MANKKRQAQPAVATETESAPPMQVIEGGASETTSPTTVGRRLEHIPPEQFAALKSELGLSNKEIAAAIGRTLSRVSELTNSKGASINVYNSFEEAVRNYAANRPETE